MLKILSASFFGMVMVGFVFPYLFSAKGDVPVLVGIFLMISPIVGGVIWIDRKIRIKR